MKSAVRFQVGDLVRISAGYDLEPGKVGRVAEPPADIRDHQKAHGQGSYVGHVRVVDTGETSPIYWIEIEDLGVPGATMGAEVEESALEPYSE